MALLEVENLQTHFGTQDGVVRAVEGLSFHIDAGETLGIVGESGCGKSVTSMSILRLIQEPPGKIAGSIRFEGRELLELPETDSAQLLARYRATRIDYLLEAAPGSLPHKRPPKLSVSRVVTGLGKKRNEGKKRA